MRFRLTAWFGFLAGCSYVAPIDPQGERLGGVITGEVVATIRGPAAPAIVLVYDAGNPPPPAGTGSPVTFATLPATAFEQGTSGLRAAPYRVTDLPPGRYLLQALMDHDEDFNPFDSVTAGSTCGDLVGGHIDDLDTPALQPVDVGAQALVADVPIVLATEVPTERPSFTLDVDVVDRAAALDPTTPQTFSLIPVAFDVPLSDSLSLSFDGPCLPSDFSPVCDLTAYATCETAMWTEVVDADLDGLPDERSDLPGVPDVWPRVYLQWLDAPPGESWSAEAVPWLAELGAMAFGAPAPIPFGQALPASELSVTWLPVARHDHPGGALIDDQGMPYDLVDLRQSGAVDDIPAGSWSVTVVSRTGQTWTLPNRLGGADIPLLSEHQSTALEIR